MVSAARLYSVYVLLGSLGMGSSRRILDPSLDLLALKRPPSRYIRCRVPSRQPTILPCRRLAPSVPHDVDLAQAGLDGRVTAGVLEEDEVGGKSLNGGCEPLCQLESVLRELRRRTEVVRELLFALSERSSRFPPRRMLRPSPLDSRQVFGCQGLAVDGDAVADCPSDATLIEDPAAKEVGSTDCRGGG